MIRYVLAVLLTVAILGIVAVGVDEATTLRGEQKVESAVTEIDESATGLFDEDATGDTQMGPRRVIEIALPADGYAQSSPERLEFTRVTERNATRVVYQFDGGAERSTIVHAPLVQNGRDSFELSGYTGDQTLVLELTLDDEGQRVVDVTVRS